MRTICFSMGDLKHTCPNRVQECSVAQWGLETPHAQTGKVYCHSYPPPSEHGLMSLHMYIWPLIRLALAQSVPIIISPAMWTALCNQCVPVCEHCVCEPTAALVATGGRIAAALATCDQQVALGHVLAMS